MRSFVWLTAWISLLLAGCQPASPASEVDYRADLKMTAEDCASTCRFIRGQLDITNNGQTLLCVPAVYESEAAFGALLLQYRGSRTWIEMTDSYDPNPFLSPRFEQDMQTLISWPQLVIPPGESRELHLAFDGKFDVRDQPVDALLRFIGFDCASSARTPRFKIESLPAQMDFR